MIAFVFKRGGNYSGKLRMPWETRAHVIALETTDKRAARLRLDEIVKERFAEHRGEVTPRAMREAAERPLNELLGVFLAARDARGREKSESTRAKYLSNFNTLMRGCAWAKLADVNAADVRKWAKSSKLSEKTRKDVVANMSGFCRWLVSQKLLAANPLEGVVGGDTRFDERFRRALSAEEQKRLLAAASPIRSAIYLLVLETGLRRKELNTLRVADCLLDAPRPCILVRPENAKNRKPARQWLRPHVVEAVRSVMPPDALPSEFVFQNRVPRTPRFVRDLKLAGIPFETEAGRMDFHGLRVTFCTNLLNAGVHARVVQELMRHSDIRLTMKNYTDPTQLPVADALEKLPVFEASTCAQKRTQICAQMLSTTGQGNAQTVTTGHDHEILQSG